MRKFGFYMHFKKHDFEEKIFSKRHDFECNFSSEKHDFDW